MKINIKLVLSYLIIAFISGSYSHALGEEKSRIAVMNLQGMNVSAMDAAVISEFLRNELYTTEKYIVLERGNMDQILNEQSFQQSGCTSQECAVKAGKLLNVKNVVVGSVSRLENTYFINVRLIDIEDGKVIDVADEETKSLVKMKEAVRRISAKLSGGEYQHRMREPAPAPPLKEPVPQTALNETKMQAIEKTIGIKKKRLKYPLYIGLSFGGSYSQYFNIGYIYNFNEKYGLNLQIGAHLDYGDAMVMFGGVYKNKFLVRIGYDGYLYETIFSPGIIFNFTKSKRWFVLGELMIPLEYYGIEFSKIGFGVGYIFSKKSSTTPPLKEKRKGSALYFSISATIDGYSGFSSIGYIYNFNEKYGLNLQIGTSPDYEDALVMLGGIYKNKFLVRIGYDEDLGETIFSPGIIFNFTKSKRWFVLGELIIPLEYYDMEYSKIGFGVGYKF